MTELIKYETARRALAEARSVEKAKPTGANQYVDRVIKKPEALASLLEAGIDKNQCCDGKKFHSETFKGTHNMPKQSFEYPTYTTPLAFWRALFTQFPQLG